MLLLIACGGAWAWFQAPAMAAPIDADQAIALAQRKIQRNPRDATAYHRLGDAYVMKARETGDTSYFALAERALRRALDLAPHQASVVRHLAYVHLGRQAFAEAAAQAARALEMDPTDASAYGVLGDASLELGRYREAEAAYRAMMHLDGSLDAYSRRAGLRTIRGDVAGAIADLELAIREGKANGRPRESVAWAEWQLGSEKLAVGDVAGAEAQYGAALATYPGYYRAIAGLAQVRTAQGKLTEAVELYIRAIGIIPLPEYAAALGDVYTRLGRGDEARKQYELVEYIGRLNAGNQIIHNRELALFYADRDMKPGEALELARRELEVRRDVHTYDVLAWALYRNRQYDEAAAAITKALELGTQEARFHFHAGMIHRDRGDTGKAREHLARALAINPYFHVLHTDLARRTLSDLERDGK